MMAATKGEYKGNGQTDAERNQQHEQSNIGLYIFAFIVILLLLRGFFPAFLGGPYIYHRRRFWQRVRRRLGRRWWLWRRRERRRQRIQRRRRRLRRRRSGRQLVKTRHFLNELEHARVHEAIRKAETGTSGDIVVCITHKAVPDALAAAQDGLHTAPSAKGGR